MSVNGVGVEITAWQIDGDDGTITSKTSIANAVHSSYTGIGVFADGDADINGSSVGGYDEGLLFSFNRTVRLDRLNMGSFGSNDDVNLHVDGINVFYDERGNDPGHDDHFDFAPGDYGTAVGTQFLIWADGSSDEFQIDGMLVSAVPVPAAAWLLFSGLIGLVGLKRKKE